ncbi:hypothetical protein [Amycolatopsis sp. H20-H5]|uniref:hypothetical protein n=1 Tax=Amycolatopsis sp. H20-H5 TaxID=3046309 RepID=UPI003FA3D3EB
MADPVPLFSRLKVTESPAMAGLIAGKKVAKLPLTEVLRNHPKLIVLGIGACTIGLSATYFKSTFALSLATSSVGFDRSSFLTIILIANVTQLMFVMISSGDCAVAMAGVVVATIPHCLYYAALAGMLASRFPAHVRYTGISLCYQLCGTILGGTTPIAGQFLVNVTGSITAVIVFAVLRVVLTLGCMLALPNYDERSVPLGQEERELLDDESVVGRLR